MLFLAAVLRHHAVKSRYVLTSHAALPTNHAQLMHASAPALAKKGTPSIAIDANVEAAAGVSMMIKKIQRAGLIEEIRGREYREKGAVRRVREQKEAVMRQVNRDFRTQLEWCLKQRTRCVGWHARLCVCLHVLSYRYK